ncbi:unnamed protein product, partial [Coregonus sp. 'balchen']
MLNKSDNGVYLCQADNGIGNVQGQYTLLVQDLTDDSNYLFPTSFYLPSSSPTSDSPPPSLFHDSFSQSPSLMPTMSGSGSGLSDSVSLPATSPPAIFSFSIPYPSDLTITPSSPSSSSSSPSTSSPSPSLSPSLSPSPPPVNVPSTSLSNSLFPDLPLSQEPLPPTSSSSSSPSSSSSSSSPHPTSITPSVAPPSSVSLTPSSVPIQLNGVYSFTGTYLTHGAPTNTHARTPAGTHTHTPLTHGLSVSTGTYLTHEAKGSDDAPDADTAIINAEGGHSGAEDKKEYFI